MNEMQSRQGEISLKDLLLYCLERWRWIVASMLIVAIVLGTYKYQSTVSANQLIEQSGQGISRETVTENVDDKKPATGEQSIKSYEQAIKEMEYELKIKEDYLQNSVLMQMDPYHIATGTLSYYVEDGEYKSGVLAAYKAFISGGRLAEELYELDQSVPIEDLQYLISFANSKVDAYKIDNSNQTMFSTEAGAPVFQVQIRMPDSESGELYLKYAEDIIKKYTAQLQSEVEEHRITLLSSVQSDMTDLGIQEYQSTMRAEYTTSVKNLHALRTELETIQNPQQNNQQSSQTVTSSSSEIGEAVSPMSAAMEFAVLGMILGAGLACLVLIILYWIGGKLKNIDGFTIEYGMPLLGIIRVSGMKKRIFGFIDTFVFRLGGGVYEKISLEEQTKMTVVNVQTAILREGVGRGGQRIMLAGTIPEKAAEKVCKSLTSEIENVLFSDYRQLVFQSTALKELEAYDGILFLEKKGESSSELIVQEKRMALDRDVKVLGTVVLC